MRFHLWRRTQDLVVVGGQPARRRTRSRLIDEPLFPPLINHREQFLDRGERHICGLRPAVSRLLDVFDSHPVDAFGGHAPLVRSHTPAGKPDGVDFTEHDDCRHLGAAEPSQIELIRRQTRLSRCHPHAVAGGVVKRMHHGQPASGPVQIIQLGHGEKSTSIVRSVKCDGTIEYVRIGCGVDERRSGTVRTAYHHDQVHTALFA